MIAQGAGEGKALEELQRKLEKELAHKREMVGPPYNQTLHIPLHTLHTLTL